MSFIQDPRTGDDIDTLGNAYKLNNTHITDEQRTAARNTLQRHGALDLAEMLGVTG